MRGDRQTLQTKKKINAIKVQDQCQVDKSDIGLLPLLIILEINGNVNVVWDQCNAE